MRVMSIGLLVLCLCFSLSPAASAEQSAVAPAVVVPTLVNFNAHCATLAVNR